MAQLVQPTAPSWVRLLGAFAVLPPMQAVVAYFAFPLVWAFGGHTGRPVDPSQAAGAFAILVGLIGSAVTVSGAFPVVVWLMRRGDTSLRTFLRAGLILGNAPFALYTLGLVLPLTIAHVLTGTMSGRWLSASELIAGTLRVLVLGSTLGVLSAAIFWFLTFRDLRAPNFTLRAPDAYDS